MYIDTQRQGSLGVVEYSVLTNKTHKVMNYRGKELKEDTAKLFQAVDKACKYAVVYTEVTVKGCYFEICQWCGSNSIEKKYSSEKMHFVNANCFKTLDEAQKDASILKSISNKKYSNIHIVKR
jgi:hypothetical protein